MKLYKIYFNIFGFLYYCIIHVGARELTYVTHPCYIAYEHILLRYVCIIYHHFLKTQK